MVSLQHQNHSLLLDLFLNAEAICSCATGAAENCVGGQFTTQACDGTCFIMPRFDNAQGVVAQCISVTDATNIFDAVDAPGGPTGLF